MRLTPVKEIQLGDVLGKSIYGLNNKLMLGAGYRITPEIKAKLLERGYTYVYVMEEGTESVTPQDIISDEVRLLAISRMANKAEEIKQQFKFKELSRTQLYDMVKSGYLKHIPITQNIKSVISEMLNDITSVGARVLNSMLFKSKDSYLFDHSLNTAVMSILIGKRYGFSRAELSDLAVGAFLHDFGKIVMDRLAGTPGAKNAEDLTREHPTFGYLIVKNSRNASPIASQIIYQHHEHQDGSGYPFGLKGENLPPVSTITRKSGTIYRLAEIVVVANVFDNLIFNPFHKRQLSPSGAMKQLLDGKETLYNKDILFTFAQIVPAFPEASVVRIKRLTGGALSRSYYGFLAVVAKVNENNLHRPVIIIVRDKFGKKIPPQVIDTSTADDVDLELAL